MPCLRRGGERRHDLHALDADVLDLGRDLLGDELAGALAAISSVISSPEPTIVSLGLSGFLTFVARAAADDALLQADDLVVALVDRLLPDAVAGAAVLLGDDDVHGHVAQLARQVAGVRRLEGGVGEALAGAVGGDEVLEDREALAERGEDGALDDLAGGLGHEAARAAQLADLLLVAAGAGVHHDVDRVDLGLALVGLELGEDLLGDAVRGVGPDVDHLVVALAVGDDALVELGLDLGDLAAGVGDDLLLRLRDDHVVDPDRDAGLEGGREAELLQEVEHLDGDDVARALVGVQDQVARAWTSGPGS